MIRFFCVLFLTFFVSLGHASTWLERIESFEHNKRTFTFIVIAPPNPTTGYRRIPSPEEVDLAKHLISRVEHWIRDRYVKAYPQLKPEFFEEMLGQGSIVNDPQSKMIVLFEGTDFSTILGTWRMSWSTPLPSEKFFNFRFPQSPIMQRHYATQVPLARIRELQNLGLLSTIGPSTWMLTGQTIEIKHFVTDRGHLNLGIQVAPALVDIAEHTKMIGASIRYTGAQIPVNLIKGQNRPPITPNTVADIHPNQYGITADASLADYYTGLGFAPLKNQNPLVNGSIALTISRADYIRTFLPKFASRQAILFRKQPKKIQSINQSWRDFLWAGAHNGACDAFFHTAPGEAQP